MNTPGGPIQILLVDYQLSVRRGLEMRLALEDDLRVVGAAGNATEALSLARDLRPDVILMDVEPDANGMTGIEKLRAAAPESEVVIFTLRDDAATRELVREAGAAAFVAKYETEEMLLVAIRRVARGEQRLLDGASAGREEEHRDGMRDRDGP